MDISQLGSSSNGGKQLTGRTEAQAKSFAKQHHGIRKPHIPQQGQQMLWETLFATESPLKRTDWMFSPHQTMGICQRLPIFEPQTTNQTRHKTHTATTQCCSGLPGRVHQVLVVVDQGGWDHDHCYTPESLGRCHQLHGWETHYKMDISMGNHRTLWLIFQ